ncbi:MAG: polyisoprenoid-binding protein [Anaerolineae bacterium]|nr:polyisoprenoid-binding protein [Anaerolineae bacterium]
MSWQLDKAHSSVEFSVRHMMISKVRGRFEDFEVTVNFDENNPADTTVDATIEVASINTREPQRDGHLKSPDFFNADAYPTMTFKSTKVEKVDDNHAKLTGDLTIQNVTKPVTLDVAYEGKAKNPFTGGETVGFTANGKISRKEWGMTWNQALETGGIMVGDEVTIHLEVELVKVTEEVAEAVSA